MLEKISEITNYGTAPIRRFVAVFAVVFLMVFGVTALITFLLPETYASSVRIKVEPNAFRSDQQAPTSALGVYDPYQIQTEFEILQSAAILGEVVERLGLSAKWSGLRKADKKLTRSETMQLLKDRIELRSIRSTSLIEIRVFGPDPNEAATIANTIADTYRDNRLESRRQLAASGMEALQMRFQAQEQKVRDAQRQVDELRKELGVSESDAESNFPAPTLEAETVRQLHGQLITSETLLAREKTTLSELEKLSANQRRDALQTVVGPDAELSALSTEESLAQQRLLSLQKDYSADHPVYRNAQTMAGEASKRVDQRIEGMMVGLRTRVRAQQAAVEELKGKLEKSRLEDIEKAERSRPFYKAKLQLEELTRFRTALNLKLAAEGIDAALPKAAVVEILDRAMAALRPMRPNKPKLLFLGAVAGFLLGAILGVAVTKGFTIRKAPSQAAA